MTEDEIRQHKAFEPFRAWCNVHNSGNSPDDEQYEDWVFLWEPFLAGWEARIEANG